MVHVILNDYSKTVCFLPAFYFMLLMSHFRAFACCSRLHALNGSVPSLVFMVQNFASLSTKINALTCFLSCYGKDEFYCGNLSANTLVQGSRQYLERRTYTS